MKKRLGCILLVAALCAIPIDALELNEVRYASVARAALMAQIVQIPTTGSATGDIGDDNTWTGTNIFTTATTFGSAAAAANSFVTGSNNICFEGATANDFETCITITDPGVDVTFTIGDSPDGNPWLGATAGDSASSDDLDNVFIGSAAGTAAGADAVAIDNVFIGDNAGDGVTHGDDLVLIGADSDMATATHNDSVAVGSQTIVWAEQGVVIGKSAEVSDGVAIGYLAGGPATAAADVDNVFIGNSAGTNHTTTSTDNVIVGDLGGATLTTGDQNVIIGADADVVAATDSGSVAIGFGAKAEVGGVSIGRQAGDAQGAADVGNVFLGDQAGTGVTGTGTYNTCLGDLACDDLTSGDFNVVIGAQANSGVNNNQYVVSIGYQAQIFGSSGVAIGGIAEAGPGGVSIGLRAGDDQASADVDNVFIGEQAGTAANGTSTDNTCLGDFACDGLTTGDGNVIIGADADLSVVTDSNSVAIGFGALAGGEGVSIGATAGDAQGTGDVDNVFIGSGAGTEATGTSTGNTCVGDQACDTLTTGDTNTIYGANADVGAGGTGGATAIGAGALAHGTNSTAFGALAEAGGGSGLSIGWAAGDAQTNDDQNNVFLGDRAGSAASGTSLDNTCVGDLACDTTTSGDRVVAIGANSDVGTNTDSDVTVIGESMVGKASDSILIGFGGQEYMYVHGAGKVITDATATAIVDISVASDTAGGATIEYTVTAVDTDEYQAERGAVYIAWENDSATESCAIGEIGTTVLAGGGTMAVTNACTVGLTDEVRWTFTADSSLGAPATTVTLYWSIRIDGPATTVTPQ